MIVEEGDFADDDQVFLSLTGALLRDLQGWAAGRGLRFTITGWDGPVAVLEVTGD